MRFIIFFILGLFIFSCSNDVNDVNELFDETMLKADKATDVQITYSDSSRVILKINAPIMLTYNESVNPRKEFTSGLEAIFYDEIGNIQSTVICNRAVNYEKRNEIILQDSVVWKNNSGRTIETEELIWNNKQSKVYTNKFVTLHSGKDIIYGYGFEAFDDFTHTKIKSIVKSSIYKKL